jgi:hypothetical protein
MPMTCLQLSHDWLDTMQSYWNALEGVRTRRPMAKGKAAAAHKKCLLLIEMAKAQQCGLNNFDGYSADNAWEKRTGPRLPFE